MFLSCDSDVLILALSSWLMCVCVGAMIVFLCAFLLPPYSGLLL
jgi:hypothetical protein